jgi:hypothetical protein
MNNVEEEEEEDSKEHFFLRRRVEIAGPVAGNKGQSPEPILFDTRRLLSLSLPERIPGFGKR